MTFGTTRYCRSDSGPAAVSCVRRCLPRGQTKSGAIKLVRLLPLDDDALSSPSAWASEQHISVCPRGNLNAELQSLRPPDRCRSSGRREPDLGPGVYKEPSAALAGSRVHQDAERIRGNLSDHAVDRRRTVQGRPAADIQSQKCGCTRQCCLHPPADLHMPPKD